MLPAHGDVYDELQGVRFEHTDDHQLVLEVDGREVARADFAVTVTGERGSSVDTRAVVIDDDGDGSASDEGAQVPADADGNADQGPRYRVKAQP